MPKGKPICHHHHKVGHTKKIYRRKIDKKNPKPLFSCNYFNCKKQGHQTHECRTKESEVPIVPRLEVNCYI